MYCYSFPGEVWQSASRMLGKNVKKFRESLHEGVKVAYLLQDDVSEGVAKLIKKNQQDTLPHNSQQESMDEQQVIIKSHEYYPLQDQQDEQDQPFVRIPVCHTQSNSILTDIND